MYTILCSEIGENSTHHQQYVVLHYSNVREFRTAILMRVPIMFLPKICFNSKEAESRLISEFSSLELNFFV